MSIETLGGRLFETVKRITEMDEMFDDVMRNLLYATVTVTFSLVKTIKTKKSLRLVFFIFCDVFCDLGEVDSVLVAFVTIRWTLFVAGAKPLWE